MVLGAVGKLLFDFMYISLLISSNLIYDNLISSMPLLLGAVGKPLLFAVLFLLRLPEYKNLRHPQYMPKGYSVP